MMLVTETFSDSTMPRDVCPIEVRKTILSMLHKGKAAHLGSSLSIVEMLIAVYGVIDVKKIRNHSADRDRVIVSKGHAAAATYAVMHHFGLIDEKGLATYYQDASYYAGHVSHGVEYVEHSTGALGHGLSVGCGCAIGLRSRGFVDSRVFVLVGDGEIQEGSIWEALMYSVHNRLANLIVMVDNNRISSITKTDSVVNMQPLANRFAGFGADVCEVDGHDVLAIQKTLGLASDLGKPRVVICNTVKGRGVAFAEEQPIWHYRSLSDENYCEALAGLRERD